MVETIDILPNAAYIVLWGFFLRFYWVTQTQWRRWVDDPANDPTIAIDIKQRSALRSLFTKYEEYRQVRCSTELTIALQAFAVPAHDLPPPDNPDDQGRIRKRVAIFLRDFDDDLQSVVGDELANGPMATREGRFGSEISRFDEARHEKRRITFQRWRGRICSSLALVSFIAAILVAVGAALAIAFDSDLVVTATGWPLQNTLVSVTWIALAVAIASTLFFGHFVIQRCKIVTIPVEQTALPGVDSPPENTAISWQELVLRMRRRS